MRDVIFGRPELKESNQHPFQILGGCSSGKIAETVLVAGLEDDDEYFERIRGIKNNFSRLVSLFRKQSHIYSI